MPRAPRVSLTLCKKLTYGRRAQAIGAYRTGLSMHEVVACFSIGFSRDQRSVHILTDWHDIIPTVSGAVRVPRIVGLGLVPDAHTQSALTGISRPSAI